MTVTNSNRHPRLYNATVHSWPTVAAVCTRLAYNHWSNSAAAHAGRVTYADRNKHSRHPAAPSRPAPWSRRPTRRGHPRPRSLSAALAEKSRPAVAIGRYNRPRLDAAQVGRLAVELVELVGRVNVNPDRPKQVGRIL